MAAGGWLTILKTYSVSVYWNFAYFRIFLRKHGYRLSADCFYIVVDLNNGDTDDQDEISDDLYDDEDEAVNEYLKSLQNSDNINDIQSNISLKDAFGNEQWD